MVAVISSLLVGLLVCWGFLQAGDVSSTLDEGLQSAESGCRLGSSQRKGRKKERCGESRKILLRVIYTRIYTKKGKGVPEPKEELSSTHQRKVTKELQKMEIAGVIYSIKQGRHKACATSLCKALRLAEKYPSETCLGFIPRRFSVLRFLF